MNYPGILLMGARLSWSGYRQLLFIRNFLKPLIARHSAALGYTLTPAEKKKVLFYYPMYTVLACAQMYLRLKGRKLSHAERSRLTLVGAMATLCDDLIDEHGYTRHQVLALLSQSPGDGPADKKVQLLLRLNADLYRLFEPPPKYRAQLAMALNRQAASSHQLDADITLEEVIAVCREKNGHTSLMFASLLDEDWSSIELQFIYQSAIVGQLTNDSFDMYFDTQEGIHTVFNTAPIARGRKFYIDECVKLHAMVMAGEANRNDKLKTIRRMSILHAFTLTALDHLEETETKYGGNINWKDVPRKEMVTDMWKNRNRIKTVKYMKWLGELIPDPSILNRYAEADTIRTILYDEASGELDIAFLESNKAGRYRDVPKSIFTAFMEARSLTEYYRQNFKDKFQRT